MSYRKSTYWNEMYNKIMKDTHWTSQQMHVMVPDVCKLREQEVIENLGKDAQERKSGIETMVECPSCSDKNSVNSWYDTSNDYHAVCPSCESAIQYDELPSDHAERIKDS